MASLPNTVRQRIHANQSLSQRCSIAAKFSQERRESERPCRGPAGMQQVLKYMC
jgi:hypothetical protein